MTGVSKRFLDALPDLQGAACKDIEDKEFFHPRDHQLAGRIEELRAICRSCPVIAECLQFAVEQRIGQGFWGGKTSKERRKMSRPDVAPVGRPSMLMVRGPQILQYRADGASYDEIGRHLGISEAAVIQTVVRYRQKVRESQ